MITPRNKTKGVSPKRAKVLRMFCRRNGFKPSHGRAKTKHSSFFKLECLGYCASQGQERAMGFEPTTFSLARRRTTAVLRPRTKGAEAQNRTGDTTVFSRVLYQLSYLGNRGDSILFQVIFLSTPNNRSVVDGIESGKPKKFLCREEQKGTRRLTTSEAARHLNGHLLSLLTSRDNPAKRRRRSPPKNKDRRGKPAV